MVYQYEELQCRALKLKERLAVPHLNHRRGHPRGCALDLCSGGHVGEGAEVVHLAHRHGDRGGGQADRDEGV